MHCKYHLHTADNSSRQSIFAKKNLFLVAEKISDFGGRGEKYLITRVYMAQLIDFNLVLISYGINIANEFQKEHLALLFYVA